MEVRPQASHKNGNLLKWAQFDHIYRKYNAGERCSLLTTEFDNMLLPIKVANGHVTLFFVFLLDHV